MMSPFGPFTAPAWLAPLKERIIATGGPGSFQIDIYIARNVTEKFAAILVEDASVLGATGEIIPGMKGRACHENSLNYALSRGGTVWSGFALSGGCWRVHSWVVQAERILDTTSAREKYVGVELNSNERFAACFPDLADLVSRETP